ncbi:MAG: zinc ribbon domain-containing protein [Methanobrevibacter sp.]|nr:zinc ribbon domain-containing protein [Methanobrevibacter sp.]
MKFCQSCAMPMADDDFGSQKDGSKSEDYCKYCYQNGEFTSDITMQEMIDFCVPKTAEATGMSEDEARKMSEEMFPKLKRWMK